jgi:hypothetical protein
MDFNGGQGGGRRYLEEVLRRATEVFGAAPALTVEKHGIEELGMGGVEEILETFGGVHR